MRCPTMGVYKNRVLSNWDREKKGDDQKDANNLFKEEERSKTNKIQKELARPQS